MKYLLLIILLVSCHKRIDLPATPEAAKLPPKETYQALLNFLDSHALKVSTWWEVSLITLDALTIQHNGMYQPWYFCDSRPPIDLVRTFMVGYDPSCPQFYLYYPFSTKLVLYANGKTFTWNDCPMSWSVHKLVPAKYPKWVWEPDPKVVNVHLKPRV